MRNPGAENTLTEEKKRREERLENEKFLFWGVRKIEKKGAKKKRNVRGRGRVFLLNKSTNEHQLEKGEERISGGFATPQAKKAVIGSPRQTVGEGGGERTPARRDRTPKKEKGGGTITYRKRPPYPSPQGQGAPAGTKRKKAFEGKEWRACKTVGGERQGDFIKGEGKERSWTVRLQQGRKTVC